MIMLHTKTSVTAVIPFYNEKNHVSFVISELLKIKDLTQIICVDDGSTDGTEKQIIKFFPRVKVLRYAENKGKSFAIKHCLKYIKTSHVLLFDADLYEFSYKEIEKAIVFLLHNPNSSEIILKQTQDPWISKLFRFDLLCSGERLLAKQDLTNIYNQKISNYQLEIAINDYFLKHKKVVYSIPFSSKNRFKMQKWSLRIALKKTMQFQRELFTPRFLQQLFFIKSENIQIDATISST